MHNISCFFEKFGQKFKGFFLPEIFIEYLIKITAKKASINVIWPLESKFVVVFTISLTFPEKKIFFYMFPNFYKLCKALTPKRSLFTLNIPYIHNQRIFLHNISYFKKKITKIQEKIDKILFDHNFIKKGCIYFKSVVYIAISRKINKNL